MASRGVSGEPPSCGPKYEYRVQYRRRGWAQRQSRIYQSAPPARRLVRLLRSWYPDLGRVVELHVQRRLVGEWEKVRVRDLIDVDQPRRKDGAR